MNEDRSHRDRGLTCHRGICFPRLLWGLSALIVVFEVLHGVANAAENLRHKKEMQAIRAVIDENFRTSNNEDFSGVMGTMTPHMPNREPFEAELKQFFEDTDVYTRLVDVSFMSAEMTDYGPAATVRVIQQTTARTDQEIPYSEFRMRSAMLPPWEVCEFDLVLHKIRGKWLVHRIVGDVRESQLPEKPTVKESRPKR